MYRLCSAARLEEGYEHQAQRCRLMGIDPVPLLISGSGLFDAVERTPGLFDSDDKPLPREQADRVRAVWAYDRFVCGKDRKFWIELEEARYAAQSEN
jgi:hypothetical protein